MEKAHIGHVYTTFLADFFGSVLPYEKIRKYFFLRVRMNMEKRSSKKQRSKENLLKIFVDKVSRTFSDLWGYLGIDEHRFYTDII